MFAKPLTPLFLPSLLKMFQGTREFVFERKHLERTPNLGRISDIEEIVVARKAITFKS